MGHRAHCVLNPLEGNVLKPNTWVRRSIPEQFWDTVPPMATAALHVVSKTAIEPEGLISAKMILISDTSAL